MLIFVQLKINLIFCSGFINLKKNLKFRSLFYPAKFFTAEKSNLVWSLGPATF